MGKKILFTFSIIAFLFSSNIYAEANKTKDTTKKEEISKESIAAAKKLLEEMNLEQVYKNAVNNSTANLIRANPKFKKIEDKIKAFYEKYIGWKSIKDDLAKLYAKYYTPQELKDITEFYKTKTGKKVLATMGRLSYEGQMITRKRLTPHIDELKKILDEVNNEEKKEAKAKDKKETVAKKEDKK
jgi:hypothetical protein